MAPRLANQTMGLPSKSTTSWDAYPPWSAVGPRRPCPPRARSTGIWWSLTGQQRSVTGGLTCAIGVASRVDGLPGRAFQARDLGPRWVRTASETAGSRWHERSRSASENRRSHTTFTATTSNDETAWDRVRAPPPAPRGMLRSCWASVGLRVVGRMVQQATKRCSSSLPIVCRGRSRLAPRVRLPGGVAFRPFARRVSPGADGEHDPGLS
jgi:hypothetical protein